jgi:RNA polymerase sigma-70 factor (ECF subfamily)
VDLSRVLAVAPGELRAKPREFADVFRQHFDFVWRTMRSLGVTEAAVDDAVQEVFICVHRRLPEFEGRSTLKTWIYSIAYHTAQNYRRSARRREAAELDLELPSRDPGPGEHAAGAQASRFVLEFLDKIPRERRDVFVLCVLEELSAPDVAEILQVKLNTVYSRLRLARADFRAALEQFARDGQTVEARVGDRRGVETRDAERQREAR